jgi:dTDP-4-amino-4,6-dideoxygalactose transaminase
MKKANTYTAESIPQHAVSELQKILQSGDLFRYTSPESPVTVFEKEFASYMGVKYALATSSCSAGLHLSLESLNIKKGSKVLIPAFTFAAVPSAIINAGMHPILVEVADNYRIDLEDFKLKIQEDVEVVLISHMRGHTSDMDEIMSICNNLKIPVIEDAAHSLGTVWNNKKIGTIGKIGCFSFQSYKMINAGEGGMIISNDPDLIARAIIMSGAYEHNWKKHNIDTELEIALNYWQNRLPLYNLRMQNVSAIIAGSQIPKLNDRIHQGLINHNYVADKLNESQFITVPDALPLEQRAPDSIQFNLNYFNEKEIIKFQNVANELGINIQVFGLSKDNARAFWNWEFISRDYDLPITRKMLMKACDVRLPVWLSTDDLDNIVHLILTAIDKVKNN